MTKKFKIILIPACDSIFLPGDLVSYQDNIESLAFDGDDNYILYTEAGHEAGRIHKRYVAGWRSVLLNDGANTEDGDDDENNAQDMIRHITVHTQFNNTKVYFDETRLAPLATLERKILSSIQSRDAADCDEHCEMCRSGTHDAHLAKQLAHLIDADARSRGFQGLGMY